MRPATSCLTALLRSAPRLLEKQDCATDGKNGGPRVAARLPDHDYCCTRPDDSELGGERSLRSSDKSSERAQHVYSLAVLPLMSFQAVYVAGIDDGVTLSHTWAFGVRKVIATTKRTARTHDHATSVSSACSAPTCLSLPTMQNGMTYPPETMMQGDTLTLKWCGSAWSSPTYDTACSAADLKSMAASGCMQGRVARRLGGVLTPL